MISIIIPCYNHERLLSKAVESALAQSTEKEVIVVDDGSRVPVQNQWPGQVRVIYHKRNRGLSAALNTGIKHSKSDRFIILASDDRLHPACLNLLSQHNTDIVSCNMQVGGRVVNSSPGSLEALIKGNCHSYAALIRKNLWHKIGGFKEAMNPSWEDYEFFLNAAKHKAVWHHVPMPLHIYNRNPNGRDAQAQGKDYLLRGKLEGFHNDLFGKGKGLITFVIPCYDHEKFLPEAVESALNQIYPHIRVVVVDDGSPGNIRKTLSDFASDERVTLVRQLNKHLSGARNTGIKHAFDKFNTEYLSMLDADDRVAPEYIEETLSAYQPNHYVYTDIQFIGDAWHQFKTKHFDCKLLAKRHLHQCTFLMPSKLYKDVITKRGYGYDESMKEGYEDWEFVLSAVEAGWCGKRIPNRHLFHYRFHNSGSMRTEAAKKNKELVAYIESRHPWMRSKEATDMACRTCGGMKYTKTISNNGGMKVQVNVPGIGQLDGGAALKVTYQGSTTSTITKVGAGGRVYKFSGDPTNTFGPVFSIFAKDIHLFAKGPYHVERFEVVQQEVVPETVPQQKITPQSKEEEIVAVIQDKMETISYEPDDLTELKFVAKASAKKLQDAGFSYFDDVAEANPDEIAGVLGISKKRASLIINDAKTALKELV